MTTLATKLTAGGTPPRRARALSEPPAGCPARAVPGDAGPPGVGYTFAFMHEPVHWGRLRYERYGPVFWSRAFGVDVVSLLGPGALDTVLVNRDKIFSQSGWEYFIGPFFRRGLMLLDFDEHLHHRRIMQRAFTRERLRGYLARMPTAIDRGLGSWRPGRDFLVYPAMKQLTLDIAVEVFMGAELGPRADAVNRWFIDTVRAGSAFLRVPVPRSRWRRGLEGRAELEAFFADELPNKRRGHGDDLFSALAHAESEDGDRFTDEDVIDHMIFLMMAAHDTSTITMSTMVYALAKHPEWQERAREESRALGSDRIGYEDLERLNSLDLVMREALRFLAPVPSLPRRTVRDAEVLGHYLPAGTMVSVSPYFVHHMHEWWTQPDRFDPERFTDDRREDAVHSHAWTPFGGGVHKCIGMHFGQMEIKAVMHALLRRYRWSVPDGYEMPIDFTALPKPRDDLPIRLERIS